MLCKTTSVIISLLILLLFCLSLDLHQTKLFFKACDGKCSYVAALILIHQAQCCCKTVLLTYSGELTEFDYLHYLYCFNEL